MKKNFFPVALMALAIGFNACSSDDVVNTNGDVVSGNVAVLEGGYVKMAINMPSEPSSRASNSNNDQFEDGLANEYQVKNATLILFAGDGANEDGAIFHSAYNLDKISLAKEGAQITSTMRIVKPVNSDDYKDKNTLYAYVILNKNNCVTLGSTATDLKLNLKLPSSPTTPTTPTTPTSMTGVTFGQFRQALVEGGESGFKNDGFLMNNAPLSRTADGKKYYEGEVKTLVKIDGHVYKTKAEADASDANEIFVERALAKVTMQYNNKTGELSAADATIYGNKPNKVAYEIKGWALNVTNKKSFLGRDYDAAWNGTKLTISGKDSYRFVGSTVLRQSDSPDYAKPGEGSALYRTYWGKDPNYSSYTETDFTRLKKTDPDTKVANEFGNYHPLYCMENTFDVAQMQEGSQVTRAIVKVQFNGGNTFYTFNDDNTTLYKKEDMVKRVKQAIIDNVNVFNKWNSLYTAENKVPTSLDVNDVTSIKIGYEDTDDKADDNGKVYLLDFSIKKDGKNLSASEVFTSGTLHQNIQLGNILKYNGGLAYYSIPIKHFGDNLTPWDKTKATVGNPYGDTTSEESKNSYLGRYGVLRNNWYDISVSAIRNVGSPVIPEITNTPDEVDNYIAVRINVLSWAKRTQVEEL